MDLDLTLEEFYNACNNFDNKTLIEIVSFDGESVFIDTILKVTDFKHKKIKSFTIGGLDFEGTIDFIVFFMAEN